MKVLMDRFRLLMVMMYSCVMLVRIIGMVRFNSRLSLK